MSLVDKLNVVGNFPSPPPYLSWYLLSQELLVLKLVALVRLAARGAVVALGHGVGQGQGQGGQGGRGQERDGEVGIHHQCVVLLVRLTEKLSVS